MSKTYKTEKNNLYIFLFKKNLQLMALLYYQHYHTVTELPKLRTFQVCLFVCFFLSRGDGELNDKMTKK